MRPKGEAQGGKGHCDYCLPLGDVLRPLVRFVSSVDESVDVIVTDPPYSSGGRRENARSIRSAFLSLTTWRASRQRPWAEHGTPSVDRAFVPDRAGPGPRGHRPSSLPSAQDHGRTDPSTTQPTAGRKVARRDAWRAWNCASNVRRDRDVLSSRSFRMVVHGSRRQRGRLPSYLSYQERPRDLALRRRSNPPASRERVLRPGAMENLMRHQLTHGHIAVLRRHIDLCRTASFTCRP